MFAEGVRRRVELTMAFFFFAVFVLIAAVVVPQVAADTSSGAEPVRAAFLFAAAAILHALLGISVAGPGRSSDRVLSITRRSRSADGIPVRTGIFGLFLGIMLLDAAFDLGKHVPAVPAAEASLFVCACGDLACAGLIFVMGFAHSGKPEGSSIKS